MLYSQNTVKTETLFLIQIKRELEGLEGPIADSLPQEKLHNNRQMSAYPEASGVTELSGLRLLEMDF